MNKSDAPCVLLPMKFLAALTILSLALLCPRAEAATKAKAAEQAKPAEKKSPPKKETPPEKKPPLYRRCPCCKRSRRFTGPLLAEHEQHGL